MSLRWYAFLCGFGYDVLFTIDHLRSISFFYQNAHHDWLTKEYISNWFLVKLWRGKFSAHENLRRLHRMVTLNPAWMTFKMAATLITLHSGQREHDSSLLKNIFLLRAGKIIIIHTLRVHYTHAAATLNWRYSKYTKVARVHYFFVKLHSEHIMSAWA